MIDENERSVPGVTFSTEVISQDVSRFAEIIANEYSSRYKSPKTILNLETVTNCPGLGRLFNNEVLPGDELQYWERRSTMSYSAGYRVMRGTELIARVLCKIG